MTNEMIAVIQIDETAGDIAKIYAFSEKLKQLANYIEKYSTLPPTGNYNDSYFCVKEVKDN